MTTARRIGLTLLILLLLPAPTLFAQDEKEKETRLRERLERLEAENAVLKIELRTLRERIEALEEILRTRLGKAPTEGLDERELSREELEALLEKVRPTDEDALHAPDSLLVRKPGVHHPVDLVAALGTLMKESDEANLSARVNRFIRDYSVFGETYSCLIRRELWNRLRQRHGLKSPFGDHYPERQELLSALSAIVLHYDGVTSVRVEEQKGPIQILELTLSARKTGREKVRLTAYPVNGRLLIHQLYNEGFLRQTAQLMRRIRDVQDEFATPATSFAELESRLEKGKGIQGREAVLTELKTHRRNDAQTLRLPFYRVKMMALPRGEYGLVGTPDSPSYPKLYLGPIPGKHDPTKNPYQVRTE